VIGVGPLIFAAFMLPGPPSTVIVNGVPLTQQRGDVNCSASVTTPLQNLRTDAGGELAIEAWTAACPGTAPEEPFSIVVTARLKDCRSRRDLALVSAAGQSVRRLSAEQGDGPPGFPETRRSTRAEFVVTPGADLTHDLQLELQSRDARCRAKFAIPGKYVAAMHEWERLPAPSLPPGRESFVDDAALVEAAAARALADQADD
jgi:hypothetical protein